MHGGLMLLVMRERSPQRFSIHGYLFQGRCRSCLACVLLGSCFEQDGGHHLDEVPRVTRGQRAGHGRIAGKSPGPVQMLPQPTGAQVSPLQRSVDRGFSRQFSQASGG
jgi:hypothetical protein